MARGPFSASNYFSLTTDTLVTAYPFTVSVWFRPTTLTACSLIGYGETTTTAFRWTLEMNSSGNARCSTTATQGFTGFNSSNALSAGNWGHFAAVWEDDTNRSVFLNGVKATNSDLRSFSTGAAWQWRIGERSLSVGAPADGYIAEPAIWTAALLDAEIQDGLASGISPAHVRTQALVSYPPLVRGNRDLTGVVWTENGTVPVANHARVYA